MTGSFSSHVKRAEWDSFDCNVWFCFRQHCVPFTLHSGPPGAVRPSPPKSCYLCLSIQNCQCSDLSEGSLDLISDKREATWGRHTRDEWICFVIHIPHPDSESSCLCWVKCVTDNCRSNNGCRQRFLHFHAMLLNLCQVRQSELTSSESLPPCDMHLYPATVVICWCSCMFAQQKRDFCETRSFLVSSTLIWSPLNLIQMSQKTEILIVNHATCIYIPTEPKSALIYCKSTADVEELQLGFSS